MTLQTYSSAFILLVLLAFSRFAKSQPPDFAAPDGNGVAVFVDFKAADYTITYNFSKSKVLIHSTIDFQSDFAGRPVFDLVDEPQGIWLDGQLVAQQLIETPHAGSSQDFSQIRILSKSVNAGRHRLTITHTLQAFAPVFLKDGVTGGFSLSDFESRGLLERYLPSNFEFDQLHMTFHVHLIGAPTEHQIFTSGILHVDGADRWTIEFPSTSNSSAPYFDLRPKSKTLVRMDWLRSIDGRNIPITAYQAADKFDGLQPLLSEAKNTIAQYEQRFGPYPHTAFLIFNLGMQGTGGMEYVAAAASDLSSITHEIAHQYFGRGVYSLDGSSGWIDEAMASYAAASWPPNPSNLKSLDLSARSPYARANDGLGYDSGYNLLAYLNQTLVRENSNLSFDGFLKFWLGNHLGRPATNRDLEKDLSAYSHLDFSGVFRSYVYGTQAPLRLNAGNSNFR